MVVPFVSIRLPSVDPAAVEEASVVAEAAAAAVMVAAEVVEGMSSPLIYRRSKANECQRYGGGREGG
jgi:hypothetical protein